MVAGKFSTLQQKGSQPSSRRVELGLWGTPEKEIRIRQPVSAFGHRFPYPEDTCRSRQPSRAFLASRQQAGTWPVRSESRLRAGPRAEMTESSRSSAATFTSAEDTRFGVLVSALVAGHVYCQSRQASARRYQEAHQPSRSSQVTSGSGLAVNCVLRCGAVTAISRSREVQAGGPSVLL